MRNIYFSIDYELFLGTKTGTVRNCLIRPTNDLMLILDKYNIKITVFVDAAYILKMNELKHLHSCLKEDYNAVIAQIITLTENGHDIQMHFHPQWLYSKYTDITGWQLDYKHYKLSDMEDSFLKKKFAESKSLLESITNKAVIAFRAGGFCLATYKNFTSLFSENNITTDSSVLRGAVKKTKYHVYDYRKIPAKIIYNFSKSITEEDMSGKFTEVSISTISVNSMYYVFLKKKLYKNYKPSLVYRDGQSIDFVDKGRRYWSLFLQIIRKKKILVASMDGLMSGLLLRIFHATIKQQDFVMYGHPKNFSNISLSNLDNFIKRVSPFSEFKVIGNIECNILKQI
jgi:hypothetical protein